MNRTAAAAIPTLEVALSEHMNVDQLKALMGLIGGPRPQRKAELVRALVHALEGQGLKAAWERLDDLERAALAEAVHGDEGSFDSARLQAKYGSAPRLSLRDENGAAPLRLFLYPSPGGLLTLPKDLRARLRAFVPRPPPTTVKSSDQTPTHVTRSYTQWTQKGKEIRHEQVAVTVRESERAAQRELLALLRLIDAGAVKVSAATRRPTGGAMEGIANVLEGGDYYPAAPRSDRGEAPGLIRAFAWPMLLQAGGLAEIAGTTLRLSAAGRKSLSAPPGETLRKLWSKWLGTTLLDELSRIEAIKGQGGKGGKALTALSRRREAIAATLAACPVRRWISLEALRDYQIAAGHDFTVSRNPWTLYICDPQYGGLGNEHWSDYADLRYLWCVLFEYAATLGLLDVAYADPEGAQDDFRSIWGTDDLAFFSRYDGLAYVRLTQLGAYCLGSAARYAPAPIEGPSALKVLPNLEIVAPRPTTSDELALDSYAARASEGVWRLQPAKLLQAVEGGRTVAEIRQFLEARSGAALPATVARLLEETQQRCEQVRDRGLARLVACATPELAALIAHDARTRRLCMQAGERHVVVPAASETAFRRGLRELGYLLAEESIASATEDEPRKPRGRRPRAPQDGGEAEA